MGKLISAREAREQFGVSRSALLTWEEQGLIKPKGRTPGGQRRYDADDVGGLLGRSGPPPVVARSPVVAAAPAQHDDGPIEDAAAAVPPWDRRVAWAEAGLAVDRVKRERLVLRREVREEREARERERVRAEARVQREAAEHERLAALREHGRMLALFAPAEWRARVVRELEEYVTPVQLPADLSQWQATQFVDAKVRAILAEWRAEEARAAERTGKERQRRSLISEGQSYCRSETGWGWDQEVAGEARQEVERALARQVRSDWTSGQVRELVDDVLADWDEE